MTTILPPVLRTLPARAMWAAASACALLIAPAAAQCAISHGPLQSGNTDVVLGYVIRDRPLFSDTLRNVDYAVTGDYWLLTAEGCPSPTYLVKTDFRGVELETNHCYVKVADLPPAATRAVAPTPEGLVLLTLEDPARCLPVALAALRQHLLLSAEDQRDRRQSVAAGFTGAARQAAARDDLRSRFASGELFDAIAGPAAAPEQQTVSALVDQLLAATDADRRGLLVFAILHRLAIVDPGSMSLLTGLTKYPFVVARRTIGGAEGTEIVVYVDADPGSSTANVYYFYLWTDTASGSGGEPPEPITVAGFEVVDGFEITVHTQIPMGSYARLPLEQQVVDGETVWVLRAPIATGTIDGIAPRTPELAAFHASVPPAHAAACAHGLQPKSPLTYLGVTLTCP